MLLSNAPKLQSLYVCQNKLLLLSDTSQAANRPELRDDLSEILLDEVVRSSLRIVAGSTIFRLNDDGMLNTCHQDCDGPPQKGIVFDHDESIGSFEEYATNTVEGIQYLIDKYPNMSLHNRVALIVPDADFKGSFVIELQKLLPSLKGNDGRNRLFEIVDSEKAVSCIVSQRFDSAHETEWLVLDTVDNFDGLERLIVICVGLDEEGLSPLTARSRLYRAVTRAHMQVVVVNHLVRGGMLEFLGSINLEENTASDGVLDSNDRTYRYASDHVGPTGKQGEIQEFLEKKEARKEYEERTHGAGIEGAEVHHGLETPTSIPSLPPEYEEPQQPKWSTPAAFTFKVAQTVWDPDVKTSTVDRPLLDFDPYAVREEREYREAAVIIQRHWAIYRGRLGAAMDDSSRAENSELSQDEAAARTIQSAFKARQRRRRS